MSLYLSPPPFGPRTRNLRNADYSVSHSSISGNNNNNNEENQPHSAPALLSFVRVPREPRLLEVDVSGQQLEPYTHNETQRGLLQLPGRPVKFLSHRVRFEQVTSRRASYVNALLIQSRGVQDPTPCTRCLDEMRADPDALASPFPSCIRLPRYFGGCCGNCKWRDHAVRCSSRDSASPGPANCGIGTQQDTEASPILLLEHVPAESAEDAVGLDEEGTQENPVLLD